ncbi:MAG: hypothetical protein ACR2HD_04075 [Solirubrobacteraceae bacterium]
MLDDGSAVRCACIDIGSNTTRLLVGDVDAQRGLQRIHEERVFTRLGEGLGRSGATFTPEKLAAVTAVVAAHERVARELGAQTVAVVGTAALRRARNRSELELSIEGACGLAVRVLDAGAEARLAFAGATHALAGHSEGPVAVVDVGGGSSELITGSWPGAGDGGPRSVRIAFCSSIELGSLDLTEQLIAHDPPSAEELAAIEARVQQAFASVDPPAAALALAVGGSATSLARLAGRELNPESLRQALVALTAGPAREVAQRHDLHSERARLLPAGILVLAQASRALGLPLQIGAGGVREGVVLELADG